MGKGDWGLTIEAKKWNDLGFWEHRCGCIQMQDGWERCENHKIIDDGPHPEAHYELPENRVGNSFLIKDSGKREEYAGGMVRDTTEGKTNYALVADGPMLERWAIHMTKGAIKYAKRNWMLAQGEEELDRAKESAFRHFMQWFKGVNDEDHAAAVIFNINEAEYIKEKMRHE